MKIVVDLTACQGYAQCAFLAPETFRIVGVEGLIYDPEPSQELTDRVVRAAAACPVAAISVELDAP
jgi:ferredoxin